MLGSTDVGRHPTTSKCRQGAGTSEVGGRKPVGFRPGQEVSCHGMTLPTDEDMDLTTLRVYVRRALGPRTQDADPDLYRHFDSPPALSPEP